jgi:hypothetical protein
LTVNGVSPPVGRVIADRMLDVATSRRKLEDGGRADGARRVSRWRSEGAPCAPRRDRRSRRHRALDHAGGQEHRRLRHGCGFPDSADHGYWADDFTRLDRRFGSEQELAALAQTCDERGIKLLLDVVYNHVGYGSDT